ncbi:MAG: hypothetical protein Q8T09_23550 [Candidatus Melainabacteria bacterium]|nr:hypothetical protein [Candidatus Melainabacteria bacterium]
MHFIAHRINQLEQLRQVPALFGCEIDLRDRGERLILQHDPFKDGEDAEPFFAEYKKHGTLILNVKSERIEDTVLSLMEKYQIENYFFLDSSLPMIVNLTKRGEKRIALRYSEFETIETVLNFAGLVDWVWIDCFTRLSLSKEDYMLLKDANFKLCLVSPELQGRPEDIAAYKKQMAEAEIVMDAICTKQHNIDLWSA